MNQTQTPTSNNVLILGSGGAIGTALVEHFLNVPDIDRVIAISRRSQDLEHSKLYSIKTEYNEDAMAASVLFV